MEVLLVGGVGVVKGRGWGRIRRRWARRVIEPYYLSGVSGSWVGKEVGGGDVRERRL